MRILLTMIFGWGILINGSSFAAIQGRFATQLDLDGTAIIPFIPWLALIVFIVLVVILGRANKVWVRVVGFLAAYLICSLLAAYPVIIYDYGAHKISLTESLTENSRAEFESNFNVKAVWYSNSSEGKLVVVRAKDFLPSMVEYLNSVESDIVNIELTPDYE